MDRATIPPTAPHRDTVPGAEPNRRRFRLPPLTTLLAVAAGGALGGALRYAFIFWFPPTPGATPWVIFLENVSGAFLLGVALPLLVRRAPSHRDWRPFLATGVLGSYTTFSNFALDAALLTRDAPGLAALYAFGSVVCGLLAAALGLAVGRGLRGRT